MKKLENNVEKKLTIFLKETYTEKSDYSEKELNIIIEALRSNIDVYKLVEAFEDCNQNIEVLNFLIKNQNLNYLDFFEWLNNGYTSVDAEKLMKNGYTYYKIGTLIAICNLNEIKRLEKLDYDLNILNNIAKKHFPEIDLDKILEIYNNNNYSYLVNKYSN